MLGIHENNLNFEVLPIKDPKYLVIFDLSDYMEMPKQPNLRVTLPGYHKPVFLPFKKDGINKYNSNSLQPRPNCLDLFDLPDGIYKISYHIYPQEEQYIEKYHLQTNIFDREYSQFLLTLEASECVLKNNKDIRYSIMDADLFLETAKAHVEEGNIKSAEESFRKANDVLNKISRKLKGCY